MQEWDSNLLGFGISVVGMIVCVVGAGVWSCFV